jgi:hypothetical protein
MEILRGLGRGWAMTEPSAATVPAESAELVQLARPSDATAQKRVELD